MFPKVKTCRQKTGGRPPLETKNAVTELDWAISDMISHTFEKDQNIFDSDNTVFSKLTRFF
jgi:hypothetical protein